MYCSSSYGLKYWLTVPGIALWRLAPLPVTGIHPCKGADKRKIDLARSPFFLPGRTGYDAVNPSSCYHLPRKGKSKPQRVAYAWRSSGERPAKEIILGQVFVAAYEGGALHELPSITAQPRGHATEKSRSFSRVLFLQSQDTLHLNSIALFKSLFPLYELRSSLWEHGPPYVGGAAQRARPTSDHLLGQFALKSFTHIVFLHGHRTPQALSQWSFAVRSAAAVIFLSHSDDESSAAHLPSRVVLQPMGHGCE